MMLPLLGFVLALVLSLTAVGGGSLTTPALVLLLGLPAADAVGIALAFSAIIRVLAVPLYFVRGNVSSRYLGLLLIGALPGLLGGTILLRILRTRQWNSVVVVVIGVALAGSAAITIARRTRIARTARHDRWIPPIAIPIGLATGFSSAGAGAFGTMVLLTWSELPAATVVGTNLVFGLVLSAAGAGVHFFSGSIDSQSLMRLLIGGIPGALLGCGLAGRISSRRLRTAVATCAVVLGLAMVVSGGGTLFRRWSTDLKRIAEHPLPTVHTPQSIQN